LAAKENRTVRLEVKNAFGRTAVRSFSFARPAVDLSGAAAAPGDNGNAPTPNKVRQMPQIKQLMQPKVAQ
jgi:hypothetical protein